jgi:hypothetical protein
MIQDNSKDSFARFGTHFQSKVIQSLLLDPKFFDRIYDILLIEYFDSESHKSVFKKIQEYFATYKYPPTINNLEILLLKEPDELIKHLCFEILTVIKKSAVNDTPFIKDEAIKFCRHQGMKRALYNSIDLWEQEKPDEIWNVMRTALMAGEESNVGHIYWNEYALEKRIELMKRAPLPTGLKHLDEILNGGLSKGELGVVVAGTGLGKCVGKNTKIDIEYDVFDVEFEGFFYTLSEFDRIKTSLGYIHVKDLTTNHELLSIPDYAKRTKHNMPNL